MKAKKIIATAMVITMALGIMSSCGKKKTEVSEENGKMVITWLGIPWNSAIDPELSYGKKLIEEKFDVEINMINYDVEVYKQKKPTLLASGEIPDIIYEMDPSDVQTDAKQGFIMEMPYDMIKEKCPDIFAELNEEVPDAWLYSRYDGKNYGIPNIGYTGGYNAVSIWRTDWLRNVGIDKVPETIEEMHDALYKFRHNDPDGNGIKDTYGMSGDITNWATTFTDIFGAYGLLPFNWIEQDGEITYGGKDPKIKEVLSMLSEWYKEEIIDPEFITDDVYNSGMTKFKNGGVGFINNGGNETTVDTENANSTISVMKQINPNAEIECALPITGPDGLQGTFSWGKALHVNAFGKHLEDQPEKLEKILEIFEYISEDQEFAVELRRGKLGEHYEFIDASKEYFGGIKLLPPYDKEGDKYGISIGITGASFFSPITIKQETIEKYATEKYINFYAEYKKSELAKTDAFIKPDVLPSAVKYFESLRLKQLTYVADIIRGNKPVDSYDEFLTIWENEGGKDLEAEAKAMAEEKAAIYKAVGLE